MTGSQAAADLRHFTSNTNLNTHRLRSSPARSPTSIPSSPTSVHSSSSAIFERDIEPLGPPSPLSSLHSAAPDPHRIPRSKTTEQIEHSVPSVLDSAAAILASIQPSDVAVVAPAASNSSFFGGSGFASPIGSFRSRSPSPTIGGPGRAASLLLSIPQQQQQQQPVKSQTLPPTSPPAVSKPNQQPPKILTENTSPSQPPSIITPTSAYYSVADDETTSAHEDEPATAVRERSPSPLPISPTTLPQTSEVQPESFSRSPRSLSSSPSAWNNNPQNLPPLGLGSPMQSPTSPSSHSPINSASKRLSFVSYADLLTSAPTSTVPLSSLTTAASAVEPPPHITHIAGLNGGPAIGSHPGSRGTSLRGFAMGPHSPSDPFGSPKNVRDSMLVDDAGGEWEREGLGKGLEERLDVLYGPAPSITAASA